MKLRLYMILILNSLRRSTALRCSSQKIQMSTSSRAAEVYFMKLALRHAQHAFREKEVPIGAVVVDGNGTVLATARNRVEHFKDATAHAEIQCLRAASELRGNWRLSDCTLYTTVEPCAMCMGAIQGFRVRKVVYAAKDHRLGALGSWINMVDAEHPFHKVEVQGGILEEDSSILLKRFFQMRRREQADPAGLIDRASDFAIGI
eukprot:gene4603-9142_t